MVFFWFQRSSPLNKTKTKEIVPLLSKFTLHKTMSEPFGKKEKLKSKKVFDCLFSEGKSIHSFPVKLVYLPLEAEKNNKIGVSAPKRNFKRAVDRNRLKRILRESIRKNKNQLSTTTNYALFFIYTGKNIASYPEIYSAVEKLIKKFLERAATV